MSIWLERSERSLKNRLVMKPSRRLWLIEQLMLPLGDRKCLACQDRRLECEPCAWTGKYLQWFHIAVNDGRIPLDEEVLVTTRDASAARAKAYKMALRQFDEELRMAIKESYKCSPPERS